MQFESVSSGANPISKPTGLAVDDTMVAILSVGFGHSSSPAAPSGWTLVQSLDAVGNGYAELHVFTKKATSDDVAASDFNFTAGQGVIYRISGAASTVANMQYDIKEGATSLEDLTPAITGCLLLFGCVNGNNAGASDSLTAVTLTGDTNPTWTIDRSSAAAGFSNGMAHATYNSIATITDVTGDLGGTDDNIRCIVIVRPIANGSGTASLLSADADLFAPAASAGTTGTAALLSADADLFAPTSRATSPTVWTPTSKPSTTWTPQSK